MRNDLIDIMNYNINNVDMIQIFLSPITVKPIRAGQQPVYQITGGSTVARPVSRPVRIISKGEYFES